MRDVAGVDGESHWSYSAGRRATLREWEGVLFQLNGVSKLNIWTESSLNISCNEMTKRMKG